MVSGNAPFAKRDEISEAIFHIAFAVIYGCHIQESNHLPVDNMILFPHDCHKPMR
jgi:hypothetical protein